MRSGSLCYVLYIDQNEHFSARIEEGRYLSSHGNKCFIEHEQAAFEINKNYVFPDLNKALEYLVEIIMVIVEGSRDAKIKNQTYR